MYFKRLSRIFEHGTGVRVSNKMRRSFAGLIFLSIFIFFIQILTSAPSGDQILLHEARTVKAFGKRTLGASSERYPSNLELLLVQVLTRHGDRTPLTRFPFDDDVEWKCEDHLSLVTELQTQYEQQSLSSTRPLYRKKYLLDRNYLKGNCPKGQLTAIGSRQHHELGKRFRQTYVDELAFLRPSYDPSGIYVRSTDYPRTHQSAQNQLLGLYPPQHRYPPDQIFDIHTVEKSSDYMFPNYDECPGLKAFFSKVVMHSDAWKAHRQRMQTLAASLSEKLKMEKLPDWADVMDVFTCRQSHGLPLPAGVTEQEAAMAMEASQWELAHAFNYTQAAKYGIGLLVGEILQNIESKINDQIEHKFMLYSGHDTTVGPFLAALGIFDGKWPPYASNIVIELFQSEDKEHMVRVVYNGRDLLLPGCDNASGAAPGVCPLSLLRAAAKDVVPTQVQYYEFCQSV